MGEAIARAGGGIPWITCTGTALRLTVPVSTVD